MLDTKQNIYYNTVHIEQKIDQVYLKPRKKKPEKVVGKVPKQLEPAYNQPKSDFSDLNINILQSLNQKDMQLYYDKYVQANNVELNPEAYDYTNKNTNVFNQISDMRQGYFQLFQNNVFDIFKCIILFNLQGIYLILVFFTFKYFSLVY